MTPLAIYIHWPFCQSKCPYCDFNSHVAASRPDPSRWADAYRRELRHYAALLPGRRITSVFFGGGTPSLMEPATVGAVLEEIAGQWSVAQDVEITLEANPGSAEAAKFVGFRAAGVNRLSLGVQSLRDEALKFLGRAHDGREARRAIELAAQNFSRFSFDLIYARQDQTAEDWRTELREALTLAGDHLSLYQLTIEPNTQFHTRMRRGEILTAAEDPAVAMFEETQNIMIDAGLPAYEVSNHARPGGESRHNLTYWRYQDYIGIGPGAHGRYVRENVRLGTENIRAPELWLAAVSEKNHGLKSSEALDAESARREALMMGLRLPEGIARAAWREKFGAALDDFLPSQKIAALVAQHYLVSDQARLAATPAGLQRLNALLDYLLN